MLSDDGLRALMDTGPLVREESDMADRLPNGRYVKGHGQPGPGRPPREVEREYLVAFREQVPVPVWRKIIAKAVAQALAGDGVARAWVGKHLVGDNPLDVLELMDRARELLEGMTDGKA